MAPGSPKGPSAKEKKKLAKIQEQKVKESDQHVEAGVALMDKGKHQRAGRGIATSPFAGLF
jgi:hypothetical protein